MKRVECEWCGDRLDLAVVEAKCVMELVTVEAIA